MKLWYLEGGDLSMTQQAFPNRINRGEERLTGIAKG